MPDEYFELPPFHPEIFAELLDLMPDGHLRAYWKAVVAAQRIPGDDPILIAVVMMGIVTVVGRRVPEEMAELLKRLEQLMRSQSVSVAVESRFDGIKIECREAVRDIKAFKEELRTAKRRLDDLQPTLNQLVQDKVDEAIQARSYFDKHPLAVMCLGAGLVILGIVLGIAICHFYQR